MEREKIYSRLDKDNPILCADGMLGMLIIFPNTNDPRLGIQVPDEEEIRWIAVDDVVVSKKGAMRQKGAPMCPSSNGGPVLFTQALLALDWTSREGPMSDDDED